MEHYNRVGMDLGLKGRAAAVAAGSKGLGRASALALAREGVDVAICARGGDALTATAKDIEALGVRAHALDLDLVEPGACERFVDETANVFGRLDILVCNIGGPPSGPTESFAVEDFRRALEQNLLTFVRLAQAAVPHLRARGWGRILNITSAAVKQPLDALVLGNTARAGIAGFAKTLANELAPAGITVNCVAPGMHLTDRTHELASQAAAREGVSVQDVVRRFEAASPMRRTGDPADFGAVVAFLASEQANFITGTTLAVDGGSTKSLL